MRDDYLKNIILRGNELNLLEQAAFVPFPKNASAVRWAVAGAFGLLITLLASLIATGRYIRMDNNSLYEI